MNNQWTDFQILKSLNIKANPKKPPDIVAVKWHPPLSDWIKLNTDGLALGNLDVAAIGGIFRNYRGMVHGAFCMCIGNHSTFYAEMLAVICGIEIAWNREWRIIWLEVDSKAVLACLTSRKLKPPWSLIIRWENCLHYISLMNFRSSHIYIERRE